MKLTAYQVHKFWLIRAALVLVVTALADAIVVSLTPRPLFWASLIAASLPLSMVVFLAYPLLRDERRKSDAAKTH